MVGIRKGGRIRRWDPVGGSSLQGHRPETYALFWVSLVALFPCKCELNVILQGFNLDKWASHSLRELSPSVEKHRFHVSVDRSFSYVCVWGVTVICGSGSRAVQELYTFKQGLGHPWVLTEVVSHTPQPTATDSVSSQSRTLYIDTLGKFPLVPTHSKTQCQLSGKVCSW